MSINLDKKYEKYLSKYNQLFTQINGGNFFSFKQKTEPKTKPKTKPKTEQKSNHDKQHSENSKLKLLKEKLVTGNIYKMIDLYSDYDDYFYLYVNGDFVYLIEAKKMNRMMQQKMNRIQTGKKVSIQ